MEENLQSKSSSSYKLQGTSIKIVISLAKSEHRGSDEKVKEKVEESEGFQKITIFITTEDEASSGQKQDAASDTCDINFKIGDAMTSTLTKEKNFLPNEEAIPLNNHVSKRKHKSEKNDTNLKTVLPEDLGNKEKKSKGLWRWVKSTMTPEMRRKEDLIETSGESNLNNIEPKKSSQSLNQEAKEEVPKIEVSSDSSTNKGELVTHDNAANDNAANDNAANENAANDNAANDNAANDNAANDNAANDNAANDNAANDNAASDNAANDNAANDNAANDNAANDNAATDNAAIDNAATDNAANDNAANDINFISDQKTPVDSFLTCTEAPATFEVSKVEEPAIISEDTGEPQSTNPSTKPHDYFQEAPEELVYSSFTGGDQAEPDEELMEDDVNSGINKKPNEEITDSLAEDNLDLKPSNANEEALIPTKQRKSSFIARLDKAIKRRSKRKSVGIIEPAAEELPVADHETETAATEEEAKEESSDVMKEKDYKSSSLRKSLDESSYLGDDIQTLFGEASLKGNLPGDSEDVVLIEYKKRYDQLYDLV